MQTTKWIGLAFWGTHAGAVSAQQLGEVNCQGDAVVVGTIVAVKPQPARAGRGAVVMTVNADQRLEGPGGATALGLAFEAERIPDHLRPDARRLFLLRAGSCSA